MHIPGCPKNTPVGECLASYAIDESCLEVVWADASGSIVFVNKKASCLLGYGRLELLKMKVWDVNAEINSKERWDDFFNKLKNNAVVQFETKHRKKNGIIFPVSVNANYFKHGNYEFSVAFIEDITKRRKNEEGLRLCETIINNMADGVCMVRVSDGIISYATPKFESMMGYEEGGLSGIHVSKINYPSPDGDTVYQEIAKKIRDGDGEALYDVHNIRKDGSDLWCRAHSVEFRHPEYGDVYLAVQRDITAVRKETELRDKADKRRKLFVEIMKQLNDTGDDSKVVHGLLLVLQKFVGVEAIAIRLKNGDDYPYYESSGFGASFLEKENALCSCSPDGGVVKDENGNTVLDCTCGMVIMGKVDSSPCCTSGGSLWTGDTDSLIGYLELNKEEDKRNNPRNYCHQLGYQSVALIPLRSNDKIIGLLQLNDHRKDLFTLDDIIFLEEIASSIAVGLERQRVSMELRRFNEVLEHRVKERTSELDYEKTKFERIIATTTEGLVVVTKDGTISIANDAFKRIVGFAGETMKGFSVIMLSGNSGNSVASVIETALGGEAIRGVKVGFINETDNRVIPCVINAAPFPYNGDKTPKVLLTVTDISEIVDSENKMIRAEALAVVGKLAAGVAHEFNNINAVIQGNLDIILRSKGVIPDGTRQQLEVVRRMVTRGADITNNLLMFAKGNGTAQKVQSLSVIVEEAIRLIEKDFRTAGIKVYRGDLPEDLMVSANASQIGQVLMNLFINAKHAMKDSATKHIYVEMERVDKNVFLRVTDTGMGMSEEDQKNIFTPFFSTKGEHAPQGSSQATIKGTGLGLAVSHTIVVKHHNGDISVNSTLGNGATFTVSLPLVLNGKNIENKEAKEKIRNGNGERVLVVDDEEDILDIVKMVISANGYDVECFADANKALQANEKKPFDVAIVDLQMPTMSGEAFLAKLNMHEKVPAKIVLTGYPKLANKLGGLGVLFTVKKPFEVEEILLAIQNAIDKKGGASHA